MNEIIRIAIADDHTLFRKGVLKLLTPDRYDVLFDVANGKALQEEMKSHAEIPPEIIIMDIEMPGMNGYEAVSWLRENHPSVRVLVVSMVDQEEAIVRMLKLGIQGYLSKDMEPEDLHNALMSIKNKNYYYTDFVTSKLVHIIQRDGIQDGHSREFLAGHAGWDSLNDRQRDFVRHACTELKYEEIAELMHVSPKTIDGYRDVVFEKFNIKSRVGLVLYALKNKLVNL